MNTPRPDEKLSKNFWLSEFVASQTAVRKGIDNTPPQPVVANLRRLAAVLELVRAKLGHRPLFVSSGYRCEALNREVGGAIASAHKQGLAVDFVVQGLPVLDVCRKLINTGALEVLGVDQLIYECTWVHLGLVPVEQTPRRQVLTAHFAARGVSYTPGLPQQA